MRRATTASNVLAVAVTRILETVGTTNSNTRSGPLPAPSAATHAVVKSSEAPAVVPTTGRPARSLGTCEHATACPDRIVQRPVHREASKRVRALAVHGDVERARCHHFVHQSAARKLGGAIPAVAPGDKNVRRFLAVQGRYDARLMRHVETVDDVGRAGPSATAGNVVAGGERVPFDDARSVARERGGIAAPVVVRARSGERRSLQKECEAPCRPLLARIGEDGVVARIHDARRSRIARDRSGLAARNLALLVSTGPTQVHHGRHVIRVFDNTHARSVCQLGAPHGLRALSAASATRLRVIRQPPSRSGLSGPLDQQWRAGAHVHP